MICKGECPHCNWEESLYGSLKGPRRKLGAILKKRYLRDTERKIGGRGRLGKRKILE
jgi:hypothetical protein